MRRARGFTLIELLVALAVFASMAALAYGGLNAVARAKQALAEESAALWRLQFALGLIERDLRSAVARPVRDGFGGERPALVGTRSGIELTRLGAGLGTLSGAPLVERVGYQVEGRRILRQRWAVLDRAPGSLPEVRPLLEAAGAAEFRFLDRAGRWHGQWPPPTGADRGLPRAVELRLEPPGLGELRRVIALPGAEGAP
jgi:general secretion pathway protein J